MKIYISCDIEGIAGVVHGDHCGTSGGSEYSRARKWMTDEANAAALGFFEAGAEAVLINDSHGSMRNIIIEDLDPRIELISGSPKPFSMMEGVSDEFDAVAFVGYHAKQGVVGILSHTMTGTVAAIEVNGRVLGEGGVNAAIAAEYGLPVIFVAGDQSACDEAHADYKPLISVATKKAITRYSARCLTPQKAQEQIRAGAKKAYELFAAGDSAAKPFLMARPCVVDMRFTNSGVADSAMRCPGTTRIDPLTLRFEGADFVEAYKGIRGMLAMA